MTYLIRSMKTLPSPLLYIAMVFIFAIPSVADAATASITATPGELYAGGEITITWSSSDTFKCVGSGFSTGDATSGTKKVTATGSGTKTFSVTCYDDSPKCSLNLKTSFVEDAPGQNTCTGSNAKISYSPNGSCYPKSAQCQTSTANKSGGGFRGEGGGGGTYTISQYRCEGGCSTVSKSDTVRVNTPPPPPNPSVELSLSPSVVKEGNSALLSWSANRATTCRGTGFSTGGTTSGSVSVTPTGNTTYSITCDSEVYSSTPGKWRYTGSDVTDLWCTSRPGYSNYYTNNECSSSNPEGQSCTGSDFCAVNNWQVKGTLADGKQYCNLVSDLYRCDGGSAPNQISDSVTVNYNRAPNTPTITGPTSGTVGQNQTFSIRATDPDGDQVRYRIDWDPSSGVDQNLPSSGYVNSNTLLDAIRSWLTPGTYSFRARTQDQHGAQSSWRTHTITINTSGPACSDGVDNDGDGKIDYPADTGCPSGTGGTESPQCSDSIDNDGDGRIDYPNDYGCSSASDDAESPNPQCSDGIDNNGNGKIDYPADPACTSPTDGNEQVQPPASLSLDAPSLVQPNTSATLSWSASNTSSCSLAGTNGDSWTLSGTSGSKTSLPLSSETIFTLSCTDGNGDPVSTATTVKIVPSFEEI